MLGTWNQTVPSHFDRVSFRIDILESNQQQKELRSELHPPPQKNVVKIHRKWTHDPGIISIFCFLQNTRFSTRFLLQSQEKKETQHLVGLSFLDALQEIPAACFGGDSVRNFDSGAQSWRQSVSESEKWLLNDIWMTGRWLVYWNLKKNIGDLWKMKLI